MGKREKGFLGPIGDDLPSLIPLIFALIMFFYVFTFTWGVFDQRDAAFNDALAILRIGNAIKGNSYITDEGKFIGRCETAKASRRMKFLAGLLELPTIPGQSVAGFDVEKIASGELEFFGNYECANTEEMPEAENESTIVRFFPVALDVEGEENGLFYTKPMLLVVIAWK